MTRRFIACPFLAGYKLSPYNPRLAGLFEVHDSTSKRLIVSLVKTINPTDFGSFGKSFSKLYFGAKIAKDGSVYLPVEIAAHGYDNITEETFDDLVRCEIRRYQQIEDYNHAYNRAIEPIQKERDECLARANRLYDEVFDEILRGEI